MSNRAAIDFGIRFLSSKEMEHCPDEVLAQLKIPAFMFDKFCLGSNGFSGCGPIVDSEGHLEVYSELYFSLLY